MPAGALGVDVFVSYFPEIKAGQPKPPIADQSFAAAVFRVWLGDKPIQRSRGRSGSPAPRQRCLLSGRPVPPFGPGGGDRRGWSPRAASGSAPVRGPQRRP